MSSIRRFAVLATALAGAHATCASAQSERIFLDGFDPAVAFRVSDMDLRDPHVFVNFLGCRDVTDTALAGFSVNGSLQTEIQTDSDSDGKLDRSYLMLLQPLDTLDGAMGTLDYLTADCTAPMAGTSCAANGSTPVLTTYAAQTANTCLTPVASTTRPYTPAIATPSAACFATPAFTTTIVLFGTPVALHDAQLAASWTGAPPTSLGSGLMMGFLTEADANATIIPASYPLVGGQPLSSLLPGGTGNCAAHNDKDTNNGVPGWWFYFNFIADKVPYTP